MGDRWLDLVFGGIITISRLGVYITMIQFKFWIGISFVRILDALGYYSGSKQGIFWPSPLLYPSRIILIWISRTRNPSPGVKPRPDNNIFPAWMIVAPSRGWPYFWSGTIQQHSIPSSLPLQAIFDGIGQCILMHDLVCKITLMVSAPGIWNEEIVMYPSQIGYVDLWQFWKCPLSIWVENFGAEWGIFCNAADVLFGMLG